VALGATGQTLGILRAVLSSAHYSTGKWQEAAQEGLSALTLIPRGEALWLSVVETLMQVLPNVGAFERNQELSDEVLRISPAPETRTAYLRAVALQLLGYAIMGAREKGQACLDFLDRMGISDGDVLERGYTRLYRGVFTCILGSDLLAAVELAEQAAADLAESQVMYRLSLAQTVQSFAWWGLGNHQRSEHTARQGRETAREIHDDYHAALADWYLGLALSEQGDPAKLDEADACAATMVLLQNSPIFLCTSRIVTAQAALSRGDWARAEAEASSSRPTLLGIPPYGMMASAHLLTALVRQGRAAEAATIARDDLATYHRTGSPVCSEVMFKVAAAEALFEDGDKEGGERVLRDALAKIERRSAHLRGTDHLAVFLENRPENARARELARVWNLPVPMMPA
ncbi:MAG: hypothetical protein ABI560_12775, partial [Myxococcales bacterium]